MTASLTCSLDWAEEHLQPVKHCFRKYRQGCCRKHLYQDWIKEMHLHQWGAQCPACWRPQQNKEVKARKLLSLFSLVRMCIFWPWTREFLLLGYSDSEKYITHPPGSQVLDLKLNYTTVFLGSPYCRGHMVGLLCLHVNQFYTIYKISYWLFPLQNPDYYRKQ